MRLYGANAGTKRKNCCPRVRQQIDSLEMKSMRSSPYTMVNWNKRSKYCAKRLRNIPITVDCTKALVIDLCYVDAYIMRASAYWKEGNFTKALDDLDKAITLAPSDPRAYEMRGDMYERREEFGKAANDYREVARL